MPELEEDNIRAVRIVCTPDEADHFVMTYSLLSESLGALPCSSFEETPIPGASRISIEEVELNLRWRVETRLLGNFANALQHVVRATFSYFVASEYAGREGIRLFVECTCPRFGRYVLKTSLYAARRELGDLASWEIDAIGLRFTDLEKGARKCAEACLNADFATTVEQGLEEQARTE